MAITIKKEAEKDEYTKRICRLMRKDGILGGTRIKVEWSSWYTNIKYVKEAIERLEDNETKRAEDEQEMMEPDHEGIEINDNPTPPKKLSNTWILFRTKRYAEHKTKRLDMRLKEITKHVRIEWKKMPDIEKKE